MKIYLFVVVVWLHALSLPGQGVFLWNENVNGPISGDYTLPTYMGQMQIGTNTIVGASENEPTGPSWYVHGDYFTFNVPPSLRITEAFLTIDNQRTWAWIGTANFGSQLGFAQNAVNGNLLSQWSLSSVPGGDYSMYMENGDNQSFITVANYRLDFVVSPVPEPSTWALLALGSAACWCLTRRRRT